MSMPSFRSRDDPRCSLKTGGGVKEDRSSPHPASPRPAKITDSELPVEMPTEKEYDPESPIVDSNLSSSPVLNSPTEQHSSPAQHPYPDPTTIVTLREWLMEVSGSSTSRSRLPW